MDILALTTAVQKNTRQPSFFFTLQRDHSNAAFTVYISLCLCNFSFVYPFLSPFSCPCSCPFASPLVSPFTVHTIVVQPSAAAHSCRQNTPHTAQVVQKKATKKIAKTKNDITHKVYAFTVACARACACAGA